MRILRILSGAVLLGVVALAVTATPAAAHVALLESSPADGAELETTPEAVELTFSETLDIPSTTVAVTNAEGTVIEQAEPKIDGKTITQPLRLPQPGEYTVAYRIVSEDGHPVEDSISFLVASVPEADRSEVPESSGESKDDAAASADSGIGWGTVAAIAAGVVVVIGGIVLLVRRGSRDS